MKHILFLVFLSLLLVWSAGPAYAEAQSPTDLSSFLPLPDEARDWRPEPASLRQASGEELFQMINGGAAMYLEHGFKQALSQIFQNKNGQKISLEIFEMNDPEATRKVYALKTADEGEPMVLGDEARLADYYLNFRKATCLVTLTAFDDSGDTLSGLEILGRAVADKMPKQ